MPEQWKPVVGYEALYQVSDHGRVRPVRTMRPMRPQTDSWGYQRVALGDGHSGKKSHNIHVLVLAAFVGPRPDGMVTRHLDGDPANNHVSNLRYGTQSENLRDITRHGRHPQANKTHCPAGHEYTPENTYVQAKRPRHRHCRACARTRAAAYQARKRAKGVTP